MSLCYWTTNLTARRQDDDTRALYFVHNDHLGTPKLLTDINGSVVWEQHTTPFGEVHDTIADGIENLKGFPGQYRDGETGYVYNYFRDYDPSLGRYVQSDPIGLNGGLNTYGYALQNPTKYIDPTGEVVVVDDIIIGAAAIAIGSYVAYQVNQFFNAVFNEGANDKPLTWPNPFPNPDHNPDTEGADGDASSEEIINQCIEECMPYLDISDNGVTFHKCVADCKRNANLGCL